MQLLLQLIERVVLLGFGIDSSHGDPDLTRHAVWFFSIVLITAAFAALNGLHAVLTVNAYELLVFFCTSLLLAVRLIVDYVNRSDECAGDSASVCLGFLVVALAFTAAGMGLTVIMYSDLRWKRYKAIGANVHIRRLFMRYELFSALKSLDVQNSAIMLVTGLIFFAGLDTELTKLAFGLNIALFVVEIAWERLGSVGVRIESRGRMIGFWALSVFLPAFLIWVAVSGGQGQSLIALVSSSRSMLATMAIFAAISILNRAVTVALSIGLYRDFGEQYRGLRRLLEGPDRLRRFNRGRLQAPRSPGVRPGGRGAGEGAPPAEHRMGSAAWLRALFTPQIDRTGARSAQEIPEWNPGRASGAVPPSGGGTAGERLQLGADAEAAAASAVPGETAGGVGAAASGGSAMAGATSVVRNPFAAAAAPTASAGAPTSAGAAGSTASGQDASTKPTRPSHSQSHSHPPAREGSVDGVQLEMPAEDATYRAHSGSNYSAHGGARGRASNSSPRASGHGSRKNVLASRYDAAEASFVVDDLVGDGAFYGDDAVGHRFGGGEAGYAGGEAGYTDDGTGDGGAAEDASALSYNTTGPAAPVSASGYGRHGYGHER